MPQHINAEVPDSILVARSLRRCHRAGVVTGDAAGILDLGRLLTALRAGRGWSQEELADRSGLSVRAIRDLERGHVRRPRRASIALLTDALNLSEAERSAVAEAVQEAQPAASVVQHRPLDLHTEDSAGEAAPRYEEAAPRYGTADAVVGRDGLLSSGLVESAQLPAAVGAFTGRVDQLEELDAVLLARNRGREQGAAIADAGERGEEEDSPRERTAARQRLLEWYLQAADAAARLLYPERLRLRLPQIGAQPLVPAFADRADALAWLDSERATLVTFTRLAADVGAHQVAWLLADTLRGYLWLRMYLVDWLAVAHTGLAAALAGGDLPAQAAAQLSLGDAYQDLGQHEKATEHYAVALALMGKSDWPEGLAAVLNNLGILHWRAGRLRESESCYSQGSVIRRRIGRSPARRSTSSTSAYSATSGVG